MLSILIYVILDGYDLGVGMLMLFAQEKEKDTMVSSIGPFWDANETWLVLATGLLLVAFPGAHGQVLSTLYIPTTIMLIGLILRGVSFDFRIKVKTKHKNFWNQTLWAGSLITSLCQGYMLGIYMCGFQNTLASQITAIAVALCISSSYCLLGSSWIIMKTSRKLQKKAIKWCKYSISSLSALLLISSVLVIQSLLNTCKMEMIAHHSLALFVIIPMITLGLIIAICCYIKHAPIRKDKMCWLPFACSALIMLMCSCGLSALFYPYIIPGQITLNEAASSNEALLVILIGAIVVLPMIIGYTALSYKVFWGKAKDLTYD